MRTGLWRSCESNQVNRPPTAAFIGAPPKQTRRKAWAAPHFASDRGQVPPVGGAGLGLGKPRAYRGHTGDLCPSPESGDASAQRAGS
jgi:hypothetical protein